MKVIGEGLRHLLCRWHVDKYVRMYVCMLMCIVTVYTVLGHGGTIFVQKSAHQIKLKCTKHCA